MAAAGSVAGESLGAFLRALPVSESQRATLIARLQGTCASDLDRVPLRVAERGTFDGGSGRYVRVDAGNQAVATALAAALPDIRFEHVVERIRVDGETVHVEGEGPDGPFSLAARGGRRRRARAAGGARSGSSPRWARTSDGP